MMNCRLSSTYCSLTPLTPDFREGELPRGLLGMLEVVVVGNLLVLECRSMGEIQ